VLVVATGRGTVTPTSVGPVHVGLDPETAVPGGVADRPSTDVGPGTVLRGVLDVAATRGRRSEGVGIQLAVERTVGEVARDVNVIN